MRVWVRPSHSPPLARSEESGGCPSSSESGPRALRSTARLTLAAGSTFFENRSRRRSRKHQSNKATPAGVHFMEANQLTRIGSVKMTYEAETRKAFYSAGEFFGVAELGIRRKGDPSPDPGPTFVIVIARLAEAKCCGEFTSCGKEAIRSEEGRAALVRFVELWPKIKSVAEGLIETGDISGEQFIGKFYRRVTAGLAVQPR